MHTLLHNRIGTVPDLFPEVIDAEVGASRRRKVLELTINLHTAAGQVETCASERIISVVFVLLHSIVKELKTTGGCVLILGLLKQLLVAEGLPILLQLARERIFLPPGMVANQVPMIC